MNKPTLSPINIY